MRRLTALLALVLTVSALPPAAAMGQEAKASRPMTVIKQPPKPAPPPKPAEPEPALPIGGFTPLPSVSPLPSDPSQCRLACAENYYFCLAGADADACGPDWGQCRVSCGPSATPSWRTGGR